MPAAKEKISFQLVARFMALLLLLAATAASAQARSAAENRVWKKSAPITESLLSQPLQLLELHQVKAPLGWYDASGDTFAAEKIGTGYRSFSAFKYAEGAAGEGQAWHHIVEQTPGNVERFGAEAIHNTDNLVTLPNGPGSIHNQISGFYSSKQPFTGGQTVRQWLSTQSFEEQFAFGQRIMQQFGGGK